MTLPTFPDSQEYSPPMPMVEVGLSKPGNNRTVKLLKAVVDSGADGTLFPVDMLEKVGARCVGADGRPIQHPPTAVACLGPIAGPGRDP